MGCHPWIAGDRRRVGVVALPKYSVGGSGANGRGGRVAEVFEADQPLATPGKYHRRTLDSAHNGPKIVPFDLAADSARQIWPVHIRSQRGLVLGANRLTHVQTGLFPWRLSSYRRTNRRSSAGARRNDSPGRAGANAPTTRRRLARNQQFYRTIRSGVVHHVAGVAGADDTRAAHSVYSATGKPQVHRRGRDDAGT